METYKVNYSVERVYKTEGLTLGCKCSLPTIASTTKSLPIMPPPHIRPSDYHNYGTLPKVPYLVGTVSEVLLIATCHGKYKCHHTLELGY